MKRLWTVLPNFVDCDVFRPPHDQGEKHALRSDAGIPPDALVITSVAALKHGHKRVDYVIREFRAAARADAFLVLAGASTPETPAIRNLVASDPRIRLLADHPHGRIPELLRMADVMVLGSLFEMMPIALLEGLASGLPCLVNRHPVLEWMIGVSGGMALDMGKEGALAGVLANLGDVWLQKHAVGARQRAVGTFSRDVVIRQYVEYYRAVMQADV